MAKFLARRLLYSILVLLGVSVIVFLLMYLSPGDPVYLLVSENATKSEIETMRTVMGFNKPLYEQYWIFISGALRGNLGQSLFYKQSCASLIASHIVPTIALTSASVFISLLIGIPMGVLCGLKRGSSLDLFTMSISVLGQSIPTIGLSILLIYTFSVNWNLFPSYGYGSLKNLVLPALTLGLPIAALVTRLTRSGMVDTMSEDYIVALRAKGVKNKLINFKYALKNVLIPVVNVVGIKFGVFLGGAVVCETVFAWPGIGRLVVNAINANDYPLVQASILVVSALFVFVNLVVDIISASLNTRITLA